MTFWITTLGVTCLLAFLTYLYVRKMHINKWIVPYIKKNCHKPKMMDRPLYIYVAICDHYKPFWGNVSQEIAEHRVTTWYKEFPRIAEVHTDSQGRHPVHTFFFAEEDYNPEFLDTLYKLSKKGLSDVEIQIHHHNDSVEKFKRRLEEFRDVLFHHHGLLRKNEQDKITYGFIHGGWALNNVRPDGQLCGVDYELPVLHNTGCYADFTFPSAPDCTQPPIINSIYFAPASVDKLKAHEFGYPAAKNLWSDQDQLLIQGPLSLNWRRRKWGVFPQTENGEIGHFSPITPNRINSWIRTGVHIEGIENHIFIKLHTFGTVDLNVRYLLGEKGYSVLWEHLEKKYKDTNRFKLYYVSAREMYTTIRALCLGQENTRKLQKIIR